MVTARKQQLLDQMVADGLAVRKPRIRSGSLPRIVLKKRANVGRIIKAAKR